MTKEQYLFLLRAELSTALSGEELEDILRYYEEYFAEAGPEREREVMTELGSPQRLAEKILGQEFSNGLAPAGADYTPAGYAYEPSNQMPRWLWILLVVVAAMIAVPTVGGVILSLGIGGIVCVLVGLGLGAGGLAWGGFAGKLCLWGGGLMVLALGAVMLLGAAAAVCGAVKLCKWLWAKLRGEEEYHETDF